MPWPVKKIDCSMIFTNIEEKVHFIGCGSILGKKRSLHAFPQQLIALN